MAGGIPFPVSVEQAPDSVNAESMTSDQIRAKIHEGVDDAEAGRVRDLDEIIRSK